MIEINRDITQRKEAEEALRQSEALLRMLCETTPDPIFAKDRESRLLMANPATLRAFGKSSQEVLGKRDDELYTDFETPRATLANDRRVIESGIAEVFEETIETPYGRRVFLSTKAPSVDADGRITGIIGVARDITERKAAEEALRESEAFGVSVRDSLIEHLVVLDGQGVIIAFNRAWQQVRGEEWRARTRSELAGHELSDDMRESAKLYAWRRGDCGSGWHLGGAKWRSARIWLGVSVPLPG